MDLSTILWFVFELTRPDTNSFFVIHKVSEPHLCVCECICKTDRDKERDIKEKTAESWHLQMLTKMAYCYY